jgi:hypothetical protein
MYTVTINGIRYTGRYGLISELHNRAIQLNIPTSIITAK